MAYPKIIYNATTLTFSLPPVMQSVEEERQAVRHDSVSSSGVRQSIVERVDYFLTLQMDWVPLDADLAAWAAFIDFAILGNSFDYYPDADDALTFSTYLLEDDDWKPQHNVRTMKKFSIKMRRYVAPSAGS